MCHIRIKWHIILYLHYTIFYSKVDLSLNIEIDAQIKRLVCDDRKITFQVCKSVIIIHTERTFFFRKEMISTVFATIPPETVTDQPTKWHGNKQLLLTNHLQLEAKHFGFNNNYMRKKDIGTYLDTFLLGVVVGCSMNNCDFYLYQLSASIHWKTIIM